MKNQPLHPHTAAINHKQKIHATLARLDALSWLTETFPKAFDNSQSIQPLKIGILHDILAHAEQAEAAGISKSKLRQAVVVFTRRIDYLACIKAREMRIDLEGNPVARVSEEEAEHAASKIRRRVEKSAKNARKMLESQAPHATKQKSRASSHTPAPSSEPEFRSSFSAQPAPTRTSSVIVKRKATRTFDPNAVARLKEKLGLAQKNTMNTPIAE
ncbi:MAG: activator of prop osmoprotectant transporter [Legionella sp.]|jgi:ProP effector|nr:activator of prop osmoprotectant transporter [Legionella sp.]